MLVNRKIKSIDQLIQLLMLLPWGDIFCCQYTFICIVSHGLYIPPTNSFYEGGWISSILSKVYLQESYHFGVSTLLAPVWYTRILCCQFSRQDGLIGRYWPWATIMNHSISGLRSKHASQWWIKFNLHQDRWFWQRITWLVIIIFIYLCKILERIA